MLITDLQDRNASQHDARSCYIVWVLFDLTKESEQPIIAYSLGLSPPENIALLE